MTLFTYIYKHKRHSAPISLNSRYRCFITMVLQIVHSFEVNILYTSDSAYFILSSKVMLFHQTVYQKQQILLIHCWRWRWNKRWRPNFNCFCAETKDEDQSSNGKPMYEGSAFGEIGCCIRIRHVDELGDPSSPAGWPLNANLHPSVTA